MDQEELHTLEEARERIRLLTEENMRLRLHLGSWRLLEQQAVDQAVLWETLLDYTPIGVAFFDTALCLVSLNRVGEELVRCPARALVSHTAQEIFQAIFEPKNAMQVLCQAEHTLRTGEPYAVTEWPTYSSRYPSGIAYVDWSVRRQETPTGVVQGVVITFFDVTEHVLAKQALEESESRYRLIVETAGEGILLLDAEHRITYANRQLAAMLGYTSEEMLGHALFDFMDDEGIASAQECIHRRQPGVVQHEEQRFVRKDGQVLWTLIATTPILDAQGQLTGALGMLTDITDRKRFEEALRESEERFRQIVETAQEGIFTVDADGTITYANQQLASITGYTLTEMLGHTIFEFLYAPEMQAQALEHLTRNRQGYLEKREYHLRHLDGRDLWLLISSNPMPGGQEAAPGGLAMATDITGLKQVQEELQEREHQLEVLLDVSQELNAVLDIQTVMRRLVTTAIELVGATYGTAGRLLNGELVFTEYIGMGKVVPVDYAFAEKSGVPGWVMFTRTPYISNDAEHDPHVIPEIRQAWQFHTLVDVPILSRTGAFLGCFELHDKVDGSGFGPRDVELLQGLAASAAVALENAQIMEERLHAEEALRASEENYRSIFDNANDAIFIFDIATGKIVDANRKATEMFDYTVEEFRGLTISDYSAPYAPYLQEDATRYIQRAVAGQPQLFEWMARDRHNKLFWIEVNLKQVPIGRQERLLAIMRDISERKEVAKALERERAFLSAAIEILPFPILFLAPDRQVIRANQACFTFLATTDIQQWWVGKFLTPDTHTEIPQDHWPAMRALRGEVVKAQEGIFVLPQGQEVPILTHAAPVTVDNRQIAAVTAMQDITALKEADRAKDQFLAVISHEMLTPVTSIIGWIQEAGEDPEVLPQALEIVERSARRQKALVEDLLDISRLIHHKIVLELEPAELWQLATETVEDLVHTARERQLEIVLEPPGTPLLIQADRGRIRQVITNLLNNALKFTDPGDTITVAGCRDDTHAVLSVRDTGRGIAPEKLPTIFQPFRQIEPREVARGLGLGLALVKGLVELHGGQVAAESAGVEQGSTFTIKLPLRKA